MNEINDEGVGTSEVNEVNENSEVDEVEMDDELSKEIDEYCDAYMEEEDEKVDNAESNIEHIKCKNEKLEGTTHPETGVPFERRQVEVEGKQYEVVVPNFESKFEAQLPEDMYEKRDITQFKECNAQLKESVENDPDVRSRFDEDQIEDIMEGETPSGYTWHHDAEAGRMQLVDTETHTKTGHTGGRTIWGGGNEKR